jgi:hypothetical protein
MYKFALSCCCLSLLTLSIACTRQAKDEIIQKDIEAKVAADPQAQESQIVVESKQGKVKLNGKVKSPGAQQEVEKIAKEEPGVSDVDNETAVEPAATAAAAPVLPPPPSFSAAKKIGMFAYPKNQQSSDQQLRDEFDCYNTAEQQSGVDAEAQAPEAPSQAAVQAAQQQAVDQADQVKGGRLRGAGRGAAGGAAIGAIAGDAGKGAAIGAVAGTMRGGMKQRQANAQLKQQAAQGAASEQQQQHEQAMATYKQGRASLQRAFSACMDARGYAVK